MPEFPDSLLTIQDFIRWGASRFQEAGLFFGHGTDNALDEAVQLVVHALHLPPDLPPVYLGSRLTDQERCEVADLLRRRIEERKPAAYLTHRAWFAGLEFYVNEQVLVPRSPMAELIEAEFEPWVQAERVSRVLDLGAGSGCLGIAVAYYLPDCEVDMVDISPPALDVARENVQRQGVEDRVHVIQSDLFEALDDRRYDIILSNPPYVSDAELAGLPDEYRREPVLGLAGGVSGLDLVVRILRESARHLEPEGILIVEVGNTTAALLERFPKVPFVWLDFERGGEGIFLLTAQQLHDYRDQLNQESPEQP